MQEYIPLTVRNQNWLLRVARFFYYFGCLTVAELEPRVWGITASDLLFAVSLVIATIGIAARGAPVKLYGTKPIIFASFLYAFAGIFSAMALPIRSFEESALTVGKFLYITVPWFALGIWLLPTYLHVFRAVTLWTISGAISGLAAIGQIFISPAIIPSSGVVWGRATGFTGHPNDLGASLAIALIPAMALTTRRTITPATRVLLITCTLLTLAGLLLSGSLSSLIAALVGISIWLFLSGKSRQGLSLVAVSILGVGAFTFLKSGHGEFPLILRLDQLTDRGPGDSFYTRVDTFKAAWTYIAYHPLLGVGPSGHVITSAGFATHNLFLEAWYETGLFGVLSIMAIVVSLILLCLKISRRGGSPNRRNLIGALVGSVSVFLIYAQSAPVLFQRYGWTSAALLLVLYNVQIRESKFRHVNFQKHVH